MSRRSLSWCLCFLIAACGDDDALTDAGHDAGHDAGRDAGDSGMIPRRDAMPPGEDPIPACDLADPLACGAGQKCAWVLRFTSQDSAGVYTGCVDERNERELGVPCERWGRQIESVDLAFDAYVDPCAEGTFCAPDPELRDIMTCQPLCQVTGDCSQGSFCGATPISAELAVRVCMPSDDCSGVAQSGCKGDEGCYLRPNGTGDGPLAVCVPFSPRNGVTGAPGDACAAAGIQYINACEPGSACWGDPRLPPSQWTEGQIQCRRYCDPQATSGDADAGSDGCGEGECVWLADPTLDLNVAAISSVPGLCD